MKDLWNFSVGVRWMGLIDQTSGMRKVGGFDRVECLGQGDQYPIAQT